MSEAIASVIQCDINNNCFIWKHPLEDFYTGSQLIVHESQQAIFFMNGQALDSFGPGRHTLTTQNMPLVGKFFNEVTGDKTPFHCEIYFVNMTEQMAIKWGTSSKLEYMEPTYNFPIQLGACGEVFLQVANPRQLLIKVVGTERILDQNQLVEKFRAFLMLRLKNYIVSLIKQEKINVFEIDEYLEHISTVLQEKLNVDFSDYGVSLNNFIVTTIVKPEDNKDYRRFKELYFRQYADVAEAKLRQQLGIIEQQTKAQQMVIEAEGIARKRSLEGYTYQDERRFDVAEKFAENEATGQLANMGIGMGMISGIGGTVGNTVGSMMGNALDQTATPVAAALINNVSCSKCGAALPNSAKFCLQCGEKYEPPQNPENNSILCPNCGKNVPKAKFCLECGKELTEPICPKCSKKIVPGAKFCLECGEKLS